MPPHQQARLLRAIQEQVVVPVGATGAVAVAARIVAATNVDLGKAVEERRFRQDLLDRLQVLEIHLPPLRERQEDVPLLIRHFIAKANGSERAQVACHGQVLEALVQWASEGRSIRAVQNAIRRLVVLKRKGSVSADDLPMAGILPARHSAGTTDVEVDAGPGGGSVRVAIDLPAGTPYRTAIEEAGQVITETVLQRHDGNVTAAARELGISKDTWYRHQVVAPEAQSSGAMILTRPSHRSRTPPDRWHAGSRDGD